ncbi:ABC protein [Mycena sanguinolenta]|uniref:ABC protein n=1 Tax=Mycena sanguinolenta TaxID=230812 RepID=A0A8H6Z3Y9_9AGAR|nr:ABC protein [Mycena sanguinolenta]
MALAQSSSEEFLPFSCPKCMHILSLPEHSIPTTLISSDIVQTNVPPLESQIPVLQDFISKGRARMAALEAKIALLGSLMGKLVQEKDELAAEIRMHEDSLSPLRRMPTESLSHIFAFTLPPHQMDAEPAPWTVSAVCARWRAIAVSDPSLWTTIRHDLERGEGTEALKAQLQLSRSGHMPLNVIFHVHCWDALTRNDHRILDLVCVHSGRWETVSFMGPKEICHQLRCPIQGSLPKLRKLELEIPLYNLSDEEDMSWVLREAPLLQAVFFNRKLWEFPLMMVFPWSQLSRFGGSNTWEGHLSVLHSASNLVDCSLEIDNLDRSFPVDHPIFLPHLRRLSLSNSHFLGCLRTRALEELYCNFDTPVPVISFLHQQTCKLQKLVLFEIEGFLGTNPDPTDFTRVVEAVPTITRLGMFLTLPIEFIRAFRSRSSTLAPALEHLSCFLTIYSDIEHGLRDELVEAIESRWRGGPLKSVKVYCTDLAIASGRLDVLRTEGMGCRIFSAEHSRFLRDLDDIPPEHVISTTE